MSRGTSQLQPAVATPVALPYHYLTSFLVHYEGSKPFMLVSLFNFILVFSTTTIILKFCFDTQARRTEFIV